VRKKAERRIENHHQSRIKRLLIGSQHEFLQIKRARVDQWAEKPGSILECESLDRGRRTDAKVEDEAKRIADSHWRHRENSAHKKRDWPEHCATKNSGMGHGADRTLMAGKLGIVSVNVDGLDDAGESDQQDA
jgi:hypothetical protein